MAETIGYYLLGLADFFRMLVERLTEFGKWLIENARALPAAGSVNGNAS